MLLFGLKRVLRSVEKLDASIDRLERSVNALGASVSKADKLCDEIIKDYENRQDKLGDKNG